MWTIKLVFKTQKKNTNSPCITLSFSNMISTFHEYPTQTIINYCAVKITHTIIKFFILLHLYTPIICVALYIHAYIYISSSHTGSTEFPDSFFLSLSIHPYHSSLLAGLLGCILCLDRADISKSLLVGQHWHVHVQRTSLMSLSLFSSSALCVLFILLGWFVRRETSECTAGVLWDVSSRICSRQRSAYLCSSHLAFSQWVLLASIWCLHIVLWIHLHFEEIPFHFIR